MSNFKVEEIDGGKKITQGNMTDAQYNKTKKDLKKSKDMSLEDSVKFAKEKLKEEENAKKEFLKLQSMFAKGASSMKESYSTEEIKNFMNRYKMLKDLYSFKEGGLTKQMKMFDEGGLEQDGGSVDPISGNDVPIGSSKEEVRDDIPAQLSEGEFVFPADVVRYLGLDFLMKLRQKAKAGLQRMEDMGQMGNSEEATLPDDMPFTLDDLDVEEDGRVNFAEGGVADEEAGVFGKPKDTGDNEDSDEASFDDLIGGGSFGKYDELRKFIGPNGEIRYIPYKGEEPLPPYKNIVEGLMEKGYTYTPPGEEEEKPPEEQPVGTTQPVETEDKERDRQTAKEDKETRERTLDTAVQQAIEAGMKSEKDIIDWIKGGNVTAGKFKIPGFVYNNLPIPGEEFGPITNAINRNPNVQQDFNIDVQTPISKPNTNDTNAGLTGEGTVPAEVTIERLTDGDAINIDNTKDAFAFEDRKGKQKQLDIRGSIQTRKGKKEEALTQQELADSKKLNENLQGLYGESQEEITNLNKLVEDKNKEIENKNSQIANKDAQIANKDAQINKSQQQIQEQNTRISQLSSKTGSAAPNVIKDDRGTTFKGGKLTTDNEGKIVKVNDRPVVVQDNRDDEKDQNRPSSGSGTVMQSDNDSLGGSYESSGNWWNAGGLASRKPKKKKRVMKRGGLASKK